MPESRRLIIVAKKYEPELRRAVSAATNALAAAATYDAYKYIKDHLTQNQVPHDDQHMDPQHVADGHVYYHH